MKKSLRKTLLARRKSLSESEVAEKSESLFRNWQPLMVPERYRVVHTFLSIKAFREVDTSPFISYLQSFPDIQIGVPRVDFETRQVTHHPYCPTELVVSSWGIMEPPKTAVQIDPKRFDMVLVPMLGFDRFGHRIGYGGGYYDRFLAQVRPDCFRVGLCFEMGYLSSVLPVGSHDAVLHAVVTESGFRKFE